MKEHLQTLKNQLSLDDIDVSPEIIEGDQLISNICQVLNKKVWPSVLTVDNLSKHIGSVNSIYEHFKCMNVIERITLDAVVSSYIDIVQYAVQYFPVKDIDLLTSVLAQKRYRQTRLEKCSFNHGDMFMWV